MAQQKQPPVYTSGMMVKYPHPALFLYSVKQLFWEFQLWGIWSTNYKIIYTVPTNVLYTLSVLYLKEMLF